MERRKMDELKDFVEYLYTEEIPFELKRSGNTTEFEVGPNHKFKFGINDKNEIYARTTWKGEPLNRTFESLNEISHCCRFLNESNFMISPDVVVSKKLTLKELVWLITDSTRYDVQTEIKVNTSNSMVEIFMGDNQFNFTLEV